MKKKILLLYTGGTIGMVKDKKKNTLIPLNFDKLLKAVPEINSEEIDLDNISTKKPIDSSNMSSDNWIEIASIIEKNYDSYDGFVVLHGTDTMAYTASAFSFIFCNFILNIFFNCSITIWIFLYRSCSCWF